MSLSAQYTDTLAHNLRNALDLKAKLEQLIQTTSSSHGVASNMLTTEVWDTVIRTYTTNLLTHNMILEALEKQVKGEEWQDVKFMMKGALDMVLNARRLHEHVVRMQVKEDRGHATSESTVQNEAHTETSGHAPAPRRGEEPVNPSILQPSRPAPPPGDSTPAAVPPKHNVDGLRFVDLDPTPPHLNSKERRKLAKAGRASDTNGQPPSHSANSTPGRTNSKIRQTASNGNTPKGNNTTTPTSSKRGLSKEETEGTASTPRSNKRIKQTPPNAKRKSDVSMVDASFNELQIEEIVRNAKRARTASQEAAVPSFVAEYEDISAEVDARMEARNAHQQREMKKEMGIPVSEKRKRTSTGSAVNSEGNSNHQPRREEKAEIRAAKKAKRLSDFNTVQEAETLVTDATAQNPPPRRRRQTKGKKRSGQSRYSPKEAAATAKKAALALKKKGGVAR